MPSKKEKTQKEKKRARSTMGPEPSTLLLVTKIAGWILAGTFALLFLALIFRDFLLKTFLENAGSWFLGTEVTVEEVDSSLFSGQISLKGVRITNPPGFDAPIAFECVEFLAQVKYITLFSRQIILEKLYVSGIRTTAEYDRNGILNAAKVNETIQSHLAEDNAQSSPSQKPPAEGKGERTVLIEDFRLSAQALLQADRISLILPIPLRPIQQENLLIQCSSESLSQTLNRLTADLDEFCDSFLNAKGFFLDVGKNFVKGTGDTGKSLIRNTEDSGKSFWKSITDLFAQ